MPTKSDLIEFVRTLVKGDFVTNDRYEHKLDAEGWDGWPQFLSALFFLAVDRRFHGRYDEAEVIRFVAELRAKTGEGGPSIDPSEAELLIKAVLEPSVEFDIAPQAMGEIETLVVYTILTEENLSDDDLDAVLREAQSIADSHH